LGRKKILNIIEADKKLLRHFLMALPSVGNVSADFVDALFNTPHATIAVFNNPFERGLFDAYRYLPGQISGL